VSFTGTAAKPTIQRGELYRAARSDSDPATGSGPGTSIGATALAYAEGAAIEQALTDADMDASAPA
jgi:hypothetical protein